MKLSTSTWFSRNYAWTTESHRITYKGSDLSLHTLGHLTRHCYPLTNSSLHSPFPSVLFIHLFTVYLLSIIPSTLPYPLKLWNQIALEVRAFIAHLFKCFKCLQISLSMGTCTKKGGASPVVAVIRNPPVIREVWEVWVRSLGQEDPLEEGMAVCYSILVWRIPWTGEPMGCGP